MNKVRYAVVGAGWISQEAFMPAIPQAGNSAITAIVSGSPDAAGKLAAFHGVEHVFTYAQYDDMLASDVVDAVYIALPNSLHADYTIRAAKAGKHCLVEKPLAVTEEDCAAMIAAAEENGVYLMTAYRLHSEPGTLDVIRRIRSGEIGDPRIFTAVFSITMQPGNHRLEATHWGGPLQDVGVYCLNAVRHVFGCEPIEASAMASHGNDNPLFDEVPESVAVTLRFPEGRLAQFIASFGASDNDFYMVAGTKGSLLLNPGFRFETATALKKSDHLNTTWHTYPRTDHFAGMAAYFSDCILNKTPPSVAPTEGLADVVIMRAIERAIESGKTVAIAPLPPLSQPTADMERQRPLTDRRLVL